jgi:hypothetical protein
MLTLNDITPVGLCMVTQDMLDVRRYRANFCDNLLLRARDKNLEPSLTSIKIELNSVAADRKFLEGHKVAIVNNIDKILASVSARYAVIDLKAVEGIVASGKELIEKVLAANSFSTMAILEPEFKSKITLPVYGLFTEYMNKSKTSMI